MLYDLRVLVALKSTMSEYLHKPGSLLVKYSIQTLQWGIRACMNMQICMFTLMTVKSRFQVSLQNNENDR